MDKQKYEVPMVEIIMFETEDIITTSTDVDGGDVDNPFSN